MCACVRRNAYDIISIDNSNPRLCLVMQGRSTPQASINPATGAEEFGFFDTVKSWFGGKSNELDMTGIDQPLKTERRYDSVIEPITVSAKRRIENLDPSGASNSWITGGGLGTPKEISTSPRFRVPDFSGFRISMSPSEQDDQARISLGSLQQKFGLDARIHKGANDPAVYNLMADIALSDRMSTDQAKGFQARTMDLLRSGQIDRRTFGKLNQGVDITRDESPGSFLSHWSASQLMQKQSEAESQSKMPNFFDKIPKPVDYMLPPQLSMFKDLISSISRGEAYKRSAAYEAELERRGYKKSSVWRQ